MVRVLTLILFLLIPAADLLAEGKTFVYDATGTGTVDVNHSGGPYGRKLKELRFHLSGAATTSESFTLSIDSGSGTAYDVLILSEDMQGETDVFYMPENPIPLTSAVDAFSVQYTNTDSLTWGLQLIFE